MQNHCADCCEESEWIRVTVCVFVVVKEYECNTVCFLYAEWVFFF